MHACARIHIYINCIGSIGSILKRAFCRDIIISSVSETHFIYRIFVLRYVLLRFSSTKIDEIFKTEFIEETKIIFIKIINSSLILMI